MKVDHGVQHAIPEHGEPWVSVARLLTRGRALALAQKWGHETAYFLGPGDKWWVFDWRMGKGRREYDVANIGFRPPDDWLRTVRAEAEALYLRWEVRKLNNTVARRNKALDAASNESGLLWNYALVALMAGAPLNDVVRIIARQLQGLSAVTDRAKQGRKDVQERINDWAQPVDMSEVKRG